VPTETGRGRLQPRLVFVPHVAKANPHLKSNPNAAIQITKNAMDASAFAGLLGYSRIPYGAAHYGHFFRVFERVHPTYRIPHVSLVAVGALTLAWTLFDLEAVIAALVTLRILEQFVGQVVGVMLLRARQPERPRPYRIWLYPLPCLVALVGWLYLYASSGWLFIGIGAGTLTAGVAVFLLWSARARTWPFESMQ
jgi:amino acid transporter